MTPISFGVPDGQNVDVCFVKIFVATKAVDIGPIEQFESSRPDVKERDMKPWIPPPSDIKWASKNFTIISKRRQSVDSLQVAKVCPTNLISSLYLTLFRKCRRMRYQILRSQNRWKEYSLGSTLGSDSNVWLTRTAS